MRIHRIAISPGGPDSGAPPERMRLSCRAGQGPTRLPESISDDSSCFPSKQSDQYQLTDKLPQAIARELMTRTRADRQRSGKLQCLLSRVVDRCYLAPVLIDPGSSQPRRRSGCVAQCFAEERATVQTKCSIPEPNLAVRNRYESTSMRGSTSTKAAARSIVDRDLARSVVSGILENF